jgi:hypothetical protein
MNKCNANTRIQSWVQTDTGNSAAIKFGFRKTDISLKESVDGLVAVVCFICHIQSTFGQRKLSPYRLMEQRGRKRSATLLSTMERCLCGSVKHVASWRCQQ